MAPEQRPGAIRLIPVEYCMGIQYILFIAANHGCSRRDAMQVLKQQIWSSLNNADAWVLCIGILSCLGLATGVLG